MRLLLDTHILIAAIDPQGSLPRRVRELLSQQVSSPAVSVASLWEIAIKSRLGKLSLERPAAGVPDLLPQLGFQLLDIKVEHVLFEVSPWPETNDPFDRLLLAQCAVEGMQLVTYDQALADHPLAWRSASA